MDKTQLYTNGKRTDKKKTHVLWFHSQEISEDTVSLESKSRFDGDQIDGGNWEWLLRARSFSFQASRVCWKVMAMVGIFVGDVIRHYG